MVHKSINYIFFPSNILFNNLVFLFFYNWNLLLFAITKALELMDRIMIPKDQENAREVKRTSFRYSLVS